KTEIWRLKLMLDEVETAWGVIKVALQLNLTAIANGDAKPSNVEYKFEKLNTTFADFGNGKYPVAYSPTGKYTLTASKSENTLFLTEADFRSVSYSLYNLGVIQYQQKNYPEANSLFSQAYSHAPQDTSILYARAVTYLYTDLLEKGLKDMNAILDLDSTYFDSHLAILPLLQDFYLRTTGALQEEVLKVLERLGIDLEELKQIAEQQRLRQLLSEEWEGVYLLSSKFSKDIKWRSFAKLIIGTDGTVQIDNEMIENFNYSPVSETNKRATLEWSKIVGENGNSSSAKLELGKSTYGKYKKEEWEFNKSRTNIFNFFELQNQLIDQQFISLRGGIIEGNITLEEETERTVRGWTFDLTPAILAAHYKADTPTPNFNRDDYAYVSEPNQYGLMRVQGEKGLWGLTNMKGDAILPLFYEGIGIFSDGLAGIQKNKKLGFINPEGEVVISPQYDEVTIFKNGFATVKVGERTYEIDKKGNRKELVQAVQVLPMEGKDPSLEQKSNLPDIGKYEQMQVKEEDTRQKLLAPAGMVYVEGGQFVMGDNKSSDADERPAHRVDVNTFYMDKYEVTNAQFVNFLKEYGSENVKGGQYKGRPLFEEAKDRVFSRRDGKIAQTIRKGYENQPVRHITWYGANEYALFYGKRLPTEAEWEYAAKGGKNGLNYLYSGSNNADQVAWYQENANSTKVVGKKRANGLGIYDMSGNVAEWCQDWYSANAYASKNGKTAATQQKVIRGGSYYSSKSQLEVSDRESSSPNRNPYVGFRCVKDFEIKIDY
ncbi:MAG: SUMF1/EgtB/PvdO family nonheme iron enzyme, partial [Chitinophagales bacterium]